MSNTEQLQKRIDELEKELARLRAILGREIQMPLMPMKGLVQTLIDDENEEWYPKEERREFYIILNDYIDQMSFIAREFKFTLEMIWQRDIDVRKIIDDAISAQQQKTTKHTVVLDFEPASIFIEADRDRLSSICYQSVRDAIKYTPEGGEVKVTVRVEPPNKIYPQGSLLMQVYQPGIGLSKAQLKSLRAAQKNVNPFAQLRNELSARALIARHNGTREFDSEGVDKGITTSVRIPLCQIKEAETPTKREKKKKESDQC